MALNLPNFAGIQPIDMLGQFLKGQKASYAPKQMQQEQEEASLNNALKSVEAQYAEPMAQAKMQGINAPAAGEFMKALQDRSQVYQQFPEGSMERRLADEFVRRKAEGSAGTQLSINPDGTINFSQGGSRSGGGMMVNEAGEVISRPTNQTSNTLQNQKLGNAALEKVYNKVKQPYVGQGSNLQLIKDLREYSTAKSPKEKARLFEKLKQAGLAYKTLPDKVFNQLSTQNITPTVVAQEHQTKAATQGWPEFGNSILNNLPTEIQASIDESYDKLMSKVGDTSQQEAIYGFPVKPQPRNNSKYAQDDLAYTAKKYGMSVEEVLAQLGDD